MPISTTLHPIQTNLRHLLEELIQIPSVSTDREANREVLHWFEWQLAELSLRVVNFEDEGTPSLLMTTRATKRPRLLLLAHTDVTPGDEKLFRPRIRDGRLYGRGTFDMKFAIACYVKLLHELGPKLGEYDLGVMLNSDEEIGGVHGAKAMLEAGYGAQVVVDPDGAPDWTLERGAKGYHEFQIDATGTSAHGARTWEGDCAITKLTKYLAKLSQAFPAEPCGDSNHAHNTLNIGQIAGGEAANQVAARASAIVNIRTIPGVSEDDIEGLLRGIASDFPGLSIEYSLGSPALIGDMNNPFIVAYSEVLTEFLGTKPQTIMSHGATDARYFSAQNIPVVVSKPVGGPQHSDREWIDLASLEQYYGVLRRYVERIAHTSSSTTSSNRL